jgi:hypothetical protein
MDEEPVSEMRGVVSFDTEECLVLVQAPVEDVSAAFQALRSLGIRVESAGGQEVEVGDPCFIVYRLAGHLWTVIDQYHGRDARLDSADAEGLSRGLKTRALFYVNSDTAGALGYELFDHGNRLERLESYEGVEFESSLRDIAPPDPADVRKFVDALIRSEEAFLPGWSTYLGGWNHKPGDRVTIELPEVQRVDFLAP